MLRSSRHSDSANPPRAGRWRLETYAPRVYALVILLASLAAPFGGRPVLGQTVVDPRQEYNVKAVYLYSFGRYVTWPEGTFPAKDTPFVIGVLGADPFGGALDKIAETKTIQGRQILVERWKSLDEYKPSQILFLPRTTTAEQRAAAIRALNTKQVLLVGETSGFAHQGGTVNFFVDGEKVRFEINTDSVKRQQLSIDAKLLKLATTVKGP